MNIFIYDYNQMHLEISFGCQWVFITYWKAVLEQFCKTSFQRQCATSYLSLSSETRFTRVQKYSAGNKLYWRPQISWNPLLLWFSFNLPLHPEIYLCNFVIFVKIKMSCEKDVHITPPSLGGFMRGNKHCGLVWSDG